MNSYTGTLEFLPEPCRERRLAALAVTQEGGSIKLGDATIDQRSEMLDVHVLQGAHASSHCIG